LVRPESQGYNALVQANHYDSSDADSDTSDDDVMYCNCESEEPSIDDYANQKHTKTKILPTEEALVS
jgi:hypothetical protein